MIDQHWIALDGREFSYLDFGGSGPPIVALHGTFGRAATFTALAQRLAPKFRMLALDQRGHGLSEKGGSFTRGDFIGDAAAFIRHLDVGPAVVLGHSLGGINAFQVAARHPELVKALVIEDAPVVTDGTALPNPVVDVTGWPRRAATRQELVAALADLGLPSLDYFIESVVERAGGWELCFDAADMMATQQGNLGNWWPDWLASEQPALLLHGVASMLLSADVATRMSAHRPRTELASFPGCGHWIHRDDPDGYARAVIEFLEGAL